MNNNVWSPLEWKRFYQGNAHGRKKEREEVLREIEIRIVLEREFTRGWTNAIKFMMVVTTALAVIIAAIQRL